MMNTSNPAFPSLFNGIVILVAVYLDQVRNRKSAVRRREPGPKGRRVPKLTPFFVLILQL